MIKGLILDIGDVVYDIQLKYKKFSPLLMALGIEQFFLIAASFFINLGIYKKKYTKKDMDSLRKGIKPRKGVRTTLKRLKDKGISITFLTDTIVSPLRINKRLKAMGVLPYTDNIICSSIIGIHKPNKKAYDAAVEVSGLKKSELLFVGHAKDELDGAKRAGIKTIGYNLDPGAESTYSAKQFSDIIKIIGDINSKRGNR
jgi:HAD superfamily hydrolase (TIGR01509 family)